jgi:hypothetical protein
MIRSQYLQQMYAENYSLIKQYTRSVTHGESVWQPPFGGNCINWIMGHLVVSRCNFLMLLNVPSIWTMEQCLRFIPDSAPVISDDDAVPFDRLLADFDRTQDQLLDALEHVSDELLGEIKGDKTVAESLLYYHSHEAGHAGYLELLCRLARY